MKPLGLEFYRVLFEDLEPESLVKRFLRLLLDIQGVQRGSIWIHQADEYLCLEALDSQPGRETIKGTRLRADQASIVGWVIENGRMTVSEPVRDPRHHKTLEDGLSDKSTCILCYPLVLKDGHVWGAVEIIETESGGNQLNLDERFLKLLESVVDAGAVALSNALHYTDQVVKNQELEQALRKVREDVQIIGQSAPFLQAMKKVREYARTDFPVLITGESGTGKDLIATAIHRLSPRGEKPFLAQNCSAIPGTLLESELFGYKKGAFTGAATDKIGLLEAADHGTVFLDEIGDMPPDLQSRILRVVQNNEIKPLGQAKIRKIDVRIISATNQDLESAIAAKAFREDLFHRLNVLPLRLPPLRERLQDIPLLLNFFLKRESDRLGVPPVVISPEAMPYLKGYPWPGNIRELENFVKYILSTLDGGALLPRDLPDHIRRGGDRPVQRPEPGIQETTGSPGRGFSPEPAESSFAGVSWDQLQRDYALYLLHKNRWNITRAATEAGVNRSTFDSRLKKLGIQKTPRSE